MTNPFRYDPTKRVSAFIGPTISRKDARDVLDANFFGPAKMGDVYRVLGAGVELIVLIDGVFHQQQAVWQRELLEAIELGVKVIGASSMGALRAAELHAFGMIGHGQVFQWYRDGQLDGDDEVAQYHTEEAFGYQHFSTPLVDIRYQLNRAERSGILGPDSTQYVIDQLKLLPFPQRHWSTVFELLQKNGAATDSKRLETFWGPSPGSIKAADALGALKLARELIENRGTTSYAHRRPIAESQCHYLAVKQLCRGVYVANQGTVVATDDVLNSLDSRSAESIYYRTEARRRFFLRDWMRLHGLSCPESVQSVYEDSWRQSVPEFTLETWLRCNGVRKDEYAMEIQVRALEDWVLNEGPEAFGLRAVDFSLADWEDTAIPPVIRRGFEDAARNSVQVHSSSLDVHRISLPFVLDWAVSVGIRAEELTDDPAYQRILARWKTANSETKAASSAELRSACAFYEWLLRKGPWYFGYVQWGQDYAHANELRYSGRLPSIADRVSYLGQPATGRPAAVVAI